MSIAEIRDQMDGGTLIANKHYQRSSGLLPHSAKSYFIDTILWVFPFQSVYLHEYVARAQKRVRKDIVDGQQRLTVIKEFLEDGFPLSRNSRQHGGLLFSQLDDDVQDRFLAYAVPIITISQANQAEILEMFRRMNAFTVPLNEAEKRHSDFHGEFKWYVNSLSDEFAPMFISFGILTEKQIVRMADAELITDLSDILARGIQNRQPAMLRRLYKSNDEEFPQKDMFTERMQLTLSFMRDELGDIQNTFMCKSYAIYSLAAGLMHNRWGIPGGEVALGADPLGAFTNNIDAARQNILALAAAHEANEDADPFGPYVEACLSTTHRIAQRSTRARYVVRALNNAL
jgi:hypothetical protein